MVALQLTVACVLTFGVLCVRGDCRFGNVANEGSRKGNRGQFVDIDNPLNCSGSIVALHFCFYTDTIFANNQRKFYFRVYRAEGVGVLRRIHQLEKSVQIGPNEVSEASFLCYDHEYDEDEYVSVTEGDYIGVYIPSASPELSVVGRDVPGSVLHADSRSISTQFFSDRLLFFNLYAVQNTAIHLSADIVGSQMFRPFVSTNTPPNSLVPSVKVSVKTTAAVDSSLGVIIPTSSGYITPTTTASETAAPASPIPEHDEDSRQMGIEVWVIAVIAVVFLAVITGLIVIIIVLIVCLRRSKSPKSKNVIISSTSNPVYSIPNVDVGKRGVAGEENFPTAYEVPKSTLNRTPMNSTRKSTQSNHKEDHCTSQTTDQEATYSVVGPVVNSKGEGASQHTTESEEMHYEMDIFTIYSSTASLSNGDLTTRIRKVISSLKDETPVPYHVPASGEEEICKQLSQHNMTIIIPSDKIQVIGHIGSGQFAAVKKAKWLTNDGEKEVAIKTLHSDAGDTNRVKCLQEAAIMAQFYHPNIVYLHGIMKENKNISLVMEFLHGGDLREHLEKRCRDVLDATTPKVLLNYSIQVTLGMLYLSEKGFVHRDLAARNVLVSDADICKIGDFGMSRDLEDSNYYCSVGGTIPIKWTAPEAAFYRKYSTASDVWSYGCLLYEIWSLGQTPFSNILNADVLEKLTVGFRLPPPPGCPYEIYKLMIECWNPVPANRPGFRNVLSFLIGDEQQLLTIPFEDASTNKEAFCIGADLIAGHKMYIGLQTIYLSPENPITEEIYEDVV